MNKDITVSASIKRMFFDREMVIKQVGKANAKRLSRAGAFVRTRARTLLGKPVTNKVPSASAGSPPRVRSRSSHASLKKILFGLGDDRESVAVGPVAIASLRLRSSSAQTVPELLSKGGTAVVKGKRRRYRSFPFMQPALEREVEAGTIINLFKR